MLMGGAGAADGQAPQPPDSTSRPLPPQRPVPPRPAPPLASPPANICTTQWGWCQLPSITAPFGVGCTCLTVDNQEVPGTTRYYPYYGEASPYLQPHTTPPETIR